MKNKFTLIIICVVFFIITKTIIFNLQPALPDEAIFADIAKNLIKNGIPSSSLMAGIAPFIESRVYYYPPLFFYIIASGFKLGGVSLATLRIISNIAATYSLIMFYIIIKHLTKKTSLSLAGTLLLATNYFFIKSSTVGRPEIICLGFVLTSFYFFQLAQEKIQLRYWLLTGFLCSLAIQTHFFGSLAALNVVVISILKFKGKIVRFKPFWLTTTVFALACIPTFIPFISELSRSLAQTLAAMASRNPLYPQTDLAATPGLLFLEASLIIDITTGIYLFIRMKDRTTALFIIISWVWVVLGKLTFYIVYIQPFLVLGIILYYFEGRKARIKSPFLLPVIIIILVTIPNIFLTYQMFNQGQVETNKYAGLSKSVLSLIPANTRVYLSSVPDMYFAFPDNRNTLRTFPSFPAAKSDFINLLTKTDYIVINSFPDKIFFGNYLANYVAANTESATPVGYYSMEVLKLKPALQRTTNLPE